MSRARLRHPPSSQIPYGRCHCGCGRMTSIAKQTRSGRGDVQGEPVRYVRGHAPVPRGRRHYRWNGGRVNMADGYVRVHRPDHPRANMRGYVAEHVLIAERAIGRHFDPCHEVHHVNGIRDDNRRGNLVLCEDHAYHCLIERRARAHQACGNADWRRCRYCREWDSPSAMYVYGRQAHHRSCRRAHEAMV